MWKAVRVLWSCRCEVVFQKACLTVNDYLRVLHSEVLKWLAMPDLSLDHEAVRMYAGALQGWLTDRNIPVCEGSDVAGQKRPCPSPQQPSSLSSAADGRQGKQEEGPGGGRGARRPRCPARPGGVYRRLLWARGPAHGFAGYGVWFGPLDPRNMA